MKLVVPAVAAAAAATLASAALVYVQQRQKQQQRAYVELMAGLAQPQQYRDAPIVIVVDVGSSSIRASCFAMLRLATGTAEWVLIDGSLQQIHSDCIDANGEADIHQIAAKAESVVNGALKFLRATQLTSKLVGVGFSTFAMNILGINEKVGLCVGSLYELMRKWLIPGESVTPVYTYAGRRPSTAAHARQLRELLTKRGSLAEFHDRTGKRRNATHADTKCQQSYQFSIDKDATNMHSIIRTILGTVIHPAYAPAEFLRLHNEDPAVVDRVYKWQSISGFLIGKWTRAAEKNKGCVPMSFSEASWTGLFDFRHWQWDRALLEIVHMNALKMPPLADSSTPFLGLKPDFARRWPELSSVPFFLGIGDGAAANIGSKCIDSSRIAVTIGTSAAIRIVLDSTAMQGVKVPKGLWCYRIGRDHLLLGGALNDGGSVYQFFKKTLRISDEDLNEKLQQVRPNQHGISVLPFLSGERAPGWVEDATCAISGITKWTTPVEILHAALESVALRISLVFSLLANHADPNAVVVASGTALTASRVWRQLIADSMGKELILESGAVETTSRGIAVFVGSYLGLHTLHDAASFPSSRASKSKSNDSNGSQLLVSKPDVAAHAAYLEARHEQEFLYRKLYVEE